MKYINNIKKIFNNIEKRNIMLVLCSFIFLVILGLYGTYALFTYSEDLGLVNGIKTYKFILTEDNSKSVIISANNTKNIAITISNPEDITLQYGILYSSDDNLDEVNIGYLKTSEHPAKGLIEAKKEYVVEIKVDNYSDDNITLNFEAIYGLEKGGELKVSEGKKWIEEKFSTFPLNEAKIGSFIKYKGNNGCVNKSCEGENEGYIDEYDKGYCNDPSSIFTSSGWRLAYVKDNIPYLISAGGVECINGYNIGINNTLDSTSLISTLNNNALKFCNANYAYNGECTKYTSWNINENDIKNILNKDISLDTCLLNNVEECIIEDNSLIDNGGYYWIGKSFENDLYIWNSFERKISYMDTSYSLGLRPVLKLSPTIKIIGGEGKENNPYLIEQS